MQRHQRHTSTGSQKRIVVSVAKIAILIRRIATVITELSQHYQKEISDAKNKILVIKQF